MEKELKTEIRAILSARTATDADGWIVAADGVVPFTIYGIADSTALYGITVKTQTVKIADDSQTALQKLSKAFRNFGSMVVLKNDPEAIAALRRRPLCKSVLLTAKNEGDGKVCLSAYTGHSLLAKCTCRRALKSFRKSLTK